MGWGVGGCWKERGGGVGWGVEAVGRKEGLGWGGE